MNSYLKISSTYLILLVFMMCSASWAADVPALNPALEQWKTSATDQNEAALAAQLEQSAAAYETLKNYKAVFEKTELDKDSKMGETERIHFKFEKPFKLFMGWTNTHKEGLQVVYERGKHDNKLAIHKPGLMFGLAQVVFLPQDSPWIREGSGSYNIEDAGIGTFLYDFTKAVLKARQTGQLRVERVDNRWTVTFSGSTPESDYFAYKIETVFDPASQLPVEMKLYDWQSQVTGTYSYRDLQVDLDRDEEFPKQINRFLHRVYQGS